MQDRCNVKSCFVGSFPVVDMHEQAAWEQITLLLDSSIFRAPMSCLV